MSDVPVPKPLFAVGDRVRNLQTNEERFVIEAGEYGLTVLADETKGKFSNRRNWIAQNCTIITPAPFHIDDQVTVGTKSGAVGTITDIKPHHTGKWLVFCVERPHPTVYGTRMTHWVNESALHPVNPVAYDLKATDSAAEDFKLHEHVHFVEGISVFSGYIEVIENHVFDIRKSDGVLSFVAEEWVFHSHAEAEKARKRKYSNIANESDEDLNLDDMPKASDGDAKLIDYWSALAGRESRRADDNDALRKDAEERARVAELNNAKLAQQVKMLEGVVTKPVAPQQICWEIKIVKWQADLPESEKRWQDLLVDGWKENHISSIIDSRDIAWTVIVFKKQVEFTPTPPERTAASASHIAGLTSPYVSQEMQRTEPVTSDEILEPVMERVIGNYEGLFRAGFTLDEVIAQSNRGAIDAAIARGQQRIASMPTFNRSLHQLKEGN